MSRLYDPSRQFQTIAEASRTTGLSQYFIRHGCWDNTIPHVRAGAKYLINVTAMLQRLNEQSEVGARQKCDYMGVLVGTHTVQKKRRGIVHNVDL